VRDNGCPNANVAFYPLAVMVAALRPSGLPSDKQLPALTAAPNPFGSVTRLTLPEGTAADAEISIYDLTGRLFDRLVVPATGALEWHAPATLPAGLYQARYRTTAGNSRALRLVKQ
jgi:hypothetical protein